MIANISSFGSSQKVVPAAPDHVISPSDPSTGLTPTSVRTAKPRPKPKPGPGNAARTARMTAKRRKEIAKKAAKTRWGK
jgi:hypothetical protein